MLKLRTLSIVAVFSIALGFMLMAASKPEKANLVRLTVINHSNDDMTLKLVGPKKYTLTIEAEEKRVFTVPQGDYSYTVKACSVTADSTISLTKHKKLVMPVCGGSVPHAQGNEQIIDLSTHIRMVKIHIGNQAPTRTLAFLAGPSDYIFSIDSGEMKEYVVAKGDYTVRYYACGKSAVETFSAAKGSILALSCP